MSYIDLKEDEYVLNGTSETYIELRIPEEEMSVWLLTNEERIQEEPVNPEFPNGFDEYLEYLS